MGVAGSQAQSSCVPIERREAYAADITYGTNNEFGFDYLRDNMVVSAQQQVQRGLNFAIVDEVDNILIDEARTPLIISGQAERATDKYYQFAQIARQLRADRHYELDLKHKTVSLTEEGVDRVEQLAEIPDGESIYDDRHIDLTHYLEQALKAEVVFHRDKDYIVRDGEVIIVDEFTGRMMIGRRYSEGLHQAIEAKEGVRVQRQNVTMATITFQNYFRMYNKLAGMTGTAETEEEEFLRIYNLPVVVIPTNRPMIRDDFADLVYNTETAKFNAVIDEIEEMRAEGRPVLVGTVSIEASERLSFMMTQRGIPHDVLNAKQHEREAAIVARRRRSRDGHHRDEYGRPRHRHQARGRRGRIRRSAHHRHRTARGTPHRQSVTRALRPPGRSRVRRASTSRSTTSSCAGSAPTGSAD